LKQAALAAEENGVGATGRAAIRFLKARCTA